MTSWLSANGFGHSGGFGLGAEPAPSPPLGRRTDGVTVRRHVSWCQILIVLW